MSTRERAMLPAAERVNSIFTAAVEKAQFLQRLANMLDDFLSGKSRRSYFRTVRQQRWA